MTDAELATAQLRAAGIEPAVDEIEPLLAGWDWVRAVAALVWSVNVSNIEQSD